MSNSILPDFEVEPEIPPPETETETEPTVKDEKKEEVEMEVKEIEEKPQDEIFVKETKPKKKRKPMSEAHLNKLKIAREKSLERRRAVSEAKKVQKESQRLLKKEKMDAKVSKRLEEDAMIAMKAKIYNDAKEKSGWDEEKLVGLMTRTIDNYIEKKKSMKPAPKVHIPNKPAYPQYSPMVAQQNYQPQYIQPQHLQQHNNRNNVNDPYQSLFGFGGQ